MSALSDLKARVIELLNTVPDPGQVEGFPGSQMDAETDGDATGFYTVVLRNGTTEEPRTLGRAGKSSRIYRIEIHLHLPWDETDGENRELLFDDRMEAISDLFRDPAVLSDVCDIYQPLRWEDAEVGWATIRGGVQARYRRAVLDCTVSKKRAA